MWPLGTLTIVFDPLPRPTPLGALTMSEPDRSVNVKPDSLTLCDTNSVASEMDRPKVARNCT